MARRSPEPLERSPALRPVALDLSSIRFLPYNPNRMTSVQLDGLQASIAAYKFLEPVVVNRRADGWPKAERGLYVVGGEHRVRALRRLKQRRVPAVVVSVNPRAEKEIHLALNNRGAMDPAFLGRVLDDLQKAEANLAATGYQKAEVEALIAKALAEIKAPADFPSVDNLEATHQCPKCGYEWKGACRPRKS